MTPEQWNRVCQLVVELSRTETAGADLTDVALAAAFMLPENVRLRELREHIATPKRYRSRNAARPIARSRT